MSSTDTVIRAGRLPAETALPRPRRSPRGRIGAIVVVSLIVGPLSGAALVAAPFVPAKLNTLTGAALIGFALGWALLAVLSVRLSNQPQRWAAAPAAFFTVAGVISLLSPSSASDSPFDWFVQRGFGWVWPPMLLGLVGWMALQVHRQLVSRTRRWVLYPLLAALALTSIGGGYETVRESIDAAAHPVSGQLIDVGGHGIHLNCTGSGSPTVVVEPGLGEVSAGTAWITSAVARDTRVCVYDRPGRGWSEPVDGPQDAVTRARDLHTLLDRAHVPGPYVLAGHSFGGLYALTFAASYPEQVAGMVLLDSTAPKTNVAAPAGESADLVGRLATVLPAVAHLGTAHLIGDAYDTLPPQARDEARATASTAGAVQSYLNEFREGAVAMQQAASLSDFGAKPLIVVTAGRGHDDSWGAAQDKLATLSSNSRQRLVPSATHASLILEESDAAAASRAIRDVVAAVRSSRPLAR